MIGDSTQRVLFADSAQGTVLQTTKLQYGALTAPPLIWGSLALFGEGATTAGGSALHAFDLAGSPITDLWQVGIQVSGSVDAPLVVLGDTLWAASSAGYLFGVGIANIAAPRPRPPVQVGTGATSTITGLLATGDGNHLLVVSKTGVYGMDLTGSAPVTAWTALAGVDLTKVPAVLDGDLLLVAAGSTVYALEAYPTSATPPPKWSYPAGGTVTRLLALGSNFVLLIMDGGTSILLDNSNSTSRARFTLALPAGAAAWTGRSAETLVSLAPNGQLSAATLPVSATGTITPATVWTQQSVAFAGPPATGDGYVYGVSTDGTLRLFDLAAKSTVFTAQLGTGSLTGVVTAFAPAVRISSTAAVRFLLDGENFFPTLRDLILATTQKSFTGVTLPASLTFESLIKGLGAAGVDTYVMMWDTSTTYALTDDGKNWSKSQIASTIGTTYFGNLFTPGGAIRGDRRYNAQTYLALSGTPHVNVYLEPYYTNLDVWFERPVELGSNHQKIAIFSVNGTKLALVSGFNINTPSYFDTTAHPMTDVGGGYDGESWHDTGLLLQGDAVALIEAEFDRRWSKQNPAPAPAGNTYAKIAAWQIVRESCLDAPGVCASPRTRQPTPYTDRRITSAAVPVRVAITSNERFVVSPPSRNYNYQAILTGVHQIRDQLVSAINGASSYVYLENYAFQDVAVVQALAGRLASAPPGFAVLAVVPYPTVNDVDGDFSIGLGQHELTRYSYAALALSSANWSSAAIEGGQIFTPQSNPVKVTFDRRGIEYTQVTFSASTPVTVGIRAVVAIAPSAKPSLLFGSPARYFTTPPTDSGKALPNQRTNFRAVYVHSKLALFDDKVAMIGSANFARRSMLQDGELSAFVTDAATATAIRQQLFGHWNMTSVANWQAGMTAFAATTVASAGILPLSFASLPKYAPTWPWWLMTSLFDPSQFL